MQPTEAKRQAYCAALARGLPPGKAAAAAGVSRVTAWRWRDEDPEFAAQCQEAEQDAIEIVEDVLFEMAKDRDLGAVCFFLKSNSREKYAPRKHLTVAGDPDAPLNGQVW